MLLGYRYYDPSTGRFVSRDPAHSGRNWFAYCDSNPLVFSDPTGLMATSAMIACLDDNSRSPGLFEWLQGAFAPMVGAHRASVPSSARKGPKGTHYRIDMSQQPEPNMHIWWDGQETVIQANGGFQRKSAGHPHIVPLPKWLRGGDGYRKIIRRFQKDALRRSAGSGAAAAVPAVIAEGSGVAARGMRVVVPYAQAYDRLVGEDEGYLDVVLERGYIVEPGVLDD